MKGCFDMNFLEFIIEFLKIISFDCFMGFVLYVGYKYFDRKYNSDLQITMLEEENKYLKNENKKINGTSTDFWGKDKL